jgi:predicted nucleotidyltransferase
MVKTKSEVKRVARKLALQLEEKNIKVKQIILFGSYAAGKAKTYSDIDLAVISPSFEGKGILKRQELLGEAIYPLEEPIEAIGYTPREYRHINLSSFLAQIVATGKVIFKS